MFRHRSAFRGMFGRRQAIEEVLENRGFSGAAAQD
jgi:hypothetical protein